LGVDEKSSQIKLENRACNEAKFRIPDQAGWQPDGIAIDRQKDCTFVRKTKLPVRKLAGKFEKKYSLPHRRLFYLPAKKITSKSCLLDFLRIYFLVLFSTTLYLTIYVFLLQVP